MNPWEQTFAEMVLEQRELRHQGRWLSGPSDLLSVIGRSRRETTHSAVLAWLLDPAAPHALGGEFLRRTLQRCFPELVFLPDHLEGVVTQCEVFRERSRADIVIWGPQLTVVIEAKVDAPERPDQCNDLYADFLADPWPHFIFLTPTGRRPMTATAQAGAAFAGWSFRDVREDLRDVVASAGVNPRVNPALAAMETYLTTLDLEFP